MQEGLITLRNQAEDKWKPYHSNLYDEGHAIVPFIIGGWTQSSVFVCFKQGTIYTVQIPRRGGKRFRENQSLPLPRIWEGNFDYSDSIDFSLDSNGVPNRRPKCDIDLICDTDHKTDKH